MTVAPVAEGFCVPVASIVIVWLASARPVALNSTVCGWTLAAYVSTSDAATPSTYTCAMPRDGPRDPIQLTAVPLKVNVAWSPAVSVADAVPIPVNPDVPPYASSVWSWLQPAVSQLAA